MLRACLQLFELPPQKNQFAFACDRISTQIQIEILLLIHVQIGAIWSIIWLERRKSRVSRLFEPELIHIVFTCVQFVEPSRAFVVPIERALIPSMDLIVFWSPWPGYWFRFIDEVLSTWLTLARAPPIRKSLWEITPAPDVFFDGAEPGGSGCVNCCL